MTYTKSDHRCDARARVMLFLRQQSPTRPESIERFGGPRFMQKAIRGLASADVLPGARGLGHTKPEPEPLVSMSCAKLFLQPSHAAELPNSIFETQLRRPGAARAAGHGRRRRQGAGSPAPASKPKQAPIPLRRVEEVALDTVPAAPRPAQNRGLLVSR